MSSRVAFASLFAAALLAVAFLAGRASSEEAPAKPPQSPEEKMKEWEKMSTPGPQHEFLKTFEGTWVGKGTWTEEGTSSKFTEDLKASMVFGGRFLQVEAKMTTEATPTMPSMSMTSLYFFGFDNAKQKFVQAMLGDWSTALGTSEGTYDPATKTLTMAGAATMGPGQERRFRMEQKVVSKDEWDFVMYVTPPGGTEAKVGEAVYTRK